MGGGLRASSTRSSTSTCDVADGDRGRTSTSLEESVFAREPPVAAAGSQRIYQLKRELVEFKRAVLPLQRPLLALIGDTPARCPRRSARYFRDVQDHLTRTVEQVISFDDLLNSILQARLAQVTVDQNNDMRKIASWAAIAAVWTAIAGIYGMNFEYMPETRLAVRLPGVLSVMLGSAVVALPALPPRPAGSQRLRQ